MEIGRADNSFEEREADERNRLEALNGRKEIGARMTTEGRCGNMFP